MCGKMRHVAHLHFQIKLEQKKKKKNERSCMGLDLSMRNIAAMEKACVGLWYTSEVDSRSEYFRFSGQFDAVLIRDWGRAAFIRQP